VVARFGTGDSRIDVRRVATTGLAAHRRAVRQTTAAWSAIGAELARNRHVVLPTGVRRELAAGRVDARIPAALATLEQSSPIHVAALPAVPGEIGPKRQVLLSAVGDEPLRPASAASAAVRRALLRAGPGYAPQRITETPAGLLVTYSTAPAP
jgi:hypothetical protein